MEAPKRYHFTLVTLHWLMAVLIFVNLYLGIFIFEDQGGGRGDSPIMDALVAIHMAVGVTILALLVIRYVLRIRIQRPADATAGNKLLDILAKLVHYGLYITILIVTILGLTFSLSTGRFQSTFLGAQNQFGPPPGAQFVPPDQNGNQQLPDFQGRGPGGPGPRAGFGLLFLHEFAAYALLALVTLHVLAAFYHQFIRRNSLIARMWYGAR